MSQVEQATRFVKAMQKHTNNEIENNAITRIHGQGVIHSTPTDGSSIYEVKINDEIFQIPARTDLILSVDNVVIIMYLNGNINQPWIIDRKDWSIW